MRRIVFLMSLCCSCGGGAPAVFGEGSEPGAMADAAHGTPRAVAAPGASIDASAPPPEAERLDSAADIALDAAVDVARDVVGEAPSNEAGSADASVDAPTDVALDTAQDAVRDVSSADVRDSDANTKPDTYTPDASIDASQDVANDVVGDTAAEATGDASDASTVVLPLGCGPGKRYTLCEHNLITKPWCVKDNQTGITWIRAQQLATWRDAMAHCKTAGLRLGTVAELLAVGGLANYAGCAWTDYDFEQNRWASSWSSELIQTPGEPDRALFVVPKRQVADPTLADNMQLFRCIYSGP